MLHPQNPAKAPADCRIPWFSRDQPLNWTLWLREDQPHLEFLMLAAMNSNTWWVSPLLHQSHAPPNCSHHRNCCLSAEKQIWEFPPMSPDLWTQGMSHFVSLNGHLGLVLCLWQWLQSSWEEAARNSTKEIDQNDLAWGEASSQPHAVSGRPCKSMLAGNMRLKK